MKKIADHTIKTFNDSYDRCNQDELFLERFYQHFVANPDIARRFENVDLHKQAHILKKSLYMIMMAASRGVTENDSLHKLAHSHSQMNISAQDYDWWLQTLLVTVKETDAEFNLDVAEAWKQLMQFGIDFLKQHSK